MRLSRPLRKRDTSLTGEIVPLSAYQSAVQCRRVTVVSLNDQKQTVYRETSGIKQASLGRNGSCLMLEMDPNLTNFPLLLSFNFCLSTPLISPQVFQLLQQQILTDPFLDGK